MYSFNNFNFKKYLINPCPSSLCDQRLVRIKGGEQNLLYFRELIKLCPHLYVTQQYKISFLYKCCFIVQFSFHMHPLPRVKCLSLLNLKTKCIKKIKQIHTQLITNGLSSPSNFGRLIEQYSALSASQGMNYAHLVLTHFDINPNVYLLNVLIRCSLPRYSVLVFANYVSRADLVFDDFTYIFVLGACARCSLLWEGKQIHGRIVKQGFFSNFMLQTTAIHFYARNQDVVSARRVFDEMSMRSTETWNSMIAGYCSQRERVNRCAFNAALILLRDMMVDVCGVKPNDTTMVSVLSAASQLGILESGTCIHGYIEKTIYAPENDVYIGTGLVDMYSKCGCLDSAMCIFERMREKNVLTWTAMTTGLAVHGKGKEALEVLDAMEAYGIKPNEVTFTSLLSACCHAGLVEEGLSLFDSMDRFGVVALRQHYGCIVDLLGRAGHLQEAYDFISNMKVKPDAILWRSLLGACKVHGDMLIGEKVAKVLLHIQPGQKFVSTSNIAEMSEDYIALSNVYASADRWEDVKMVREVMKHKGLEPKPGFSSVHSL